MRDELVTRRFDRAWNAPSAGGPDDEIDDELAETLRRIDALTPAPPVGFGDATDRAVAAAIAQSAIGRPMTTEATMNGFASGALAIPHRELTAARRRRSRRIAAPAPRRERRFNVGFISALIGVLLMAGLGGLLSTVQSNGSRLGSSLPAASLLAPGDPPLYRISAGDGSWQQLDQTTLAPLPGQSGPALPPLEGFGTYHARFVFAMSADGSTVAELVQKTGSGSPLDQALVFYDVHDRRKLAHLALDPTTQFGNLALSGDGRAAYLMRMAALTGSAPPPVTGLDVIDTATGARLRQIELASDGALVLGLPLFDADTARMYVLTAPDTGASGAISVAAYDLHDGTLIAQTTVIGFMPATATPAAGAQTLSAPAAALSVDGRALTLVALGVDRLVQIDTATFTQTETPVRTADGQACAPAQVNEIAATRVANGRLIVAMWTRTSLPASTSSWTEPVGLCAIDVASGAAVMQPASAILPAGWTVGGLQLSSNGAHAYLVGVSGGPSSYGATPAATAAIFGIFALDPMTLASQGHAFFNRADADTGNGYLLAETWPH